MNLERLKVFYFIAKNGSFTKAAAALNITQPPLTVAIKLLEQELQAKLFERSSKGVTLTSEGEKLFEFAKKVIEEAEITKKLIKDNGEEPQGELKIVSTPYLASVWIPHHLSSFFNKYPKIHPCITGTFEDITVNRADIAIRTFIPHHPHLVQKHFLSLHHRLWASQDYLNKYGVPRCAEDLDDHQLITFDNKSYDMYGSAHWILNVGAHKKPRKPYITCNSVEGLINIAEKGFGIIETSEEYVDLKAHNLVKVLPDITAPTVEIYYIYSTRMEESKKIHAFETFIYENFSKFVKSST
ncbi:hypothetical protein IM40_03890 [Candidatus Paracaedimonas acanthamoebae]|nr:hypothetical protein IM40_03890 [Candidatus Paracaedimonas acanthamoebae]